jgi:hypothetical protein
LSFVSPKNLNHLARGKGGIAIAIDRSEPLLESIARINCSDQLLGSIAQIGCFERSPESISQIWLSKIWISKLDLKKWAELSPFQNPFQNRNHPCEQAFESAFESVRSRRYNRADSNIDSPKDSPSLPKSPRSINPLRNACVRSIISHEFISHELARQIRPVGYGSN